jgi:glutamine amidotransferase
MIAIIDYKAGNLRSVAKALEFIGEDAAVTQDSDCISKADGVILPGVGAFADGLESLESVGLDGVIREVIDKGTPFLGICLGYQMLFDYSEEHAGNGNIVKGLGIFRGAVRQIPQNMGLKVPHMGWNNLLIQTESALFSGLPDSPFVYFVHSYYVDSDDRSIVSARCRYGIPFDVAISTGKVFGTQFHPEKSGDIGIAMLKNFMKVVRGE